MGGRGGPNGIGGARGPSGKNPGRGGIDCGGGGPRGQVGINAPS